MIYNEHCFSLQAFPDNAARREVEALAAVCPNEGCTWTGTIKKFEVLLMQTMLGHFYVDHGWWVCLLFQPKIATIYYAVCLFKIVFILSLEITSINQSMMNGLIHSTTGSMQSVIICFFLTARAVSIYCFTWKVLNKCRADAGNSVYSSSEKTKQNDPLYKCFHGAVYDLYSSLPPGYSWL